MNAKIRKVASASPAAPTNDGLRTPRLADAIVSSCRAGRTLVVGIQGGQGTGKTTLARRTVTELAGAGHRAVAFSLDDFYTGAEERAALAESLPGNPYYRIPRGMPGTHRVALLHETLTRLKAGRDVELPVFDKSARGGYGDVAPRTIPVHGRRDVVLFEGWCLGMPRATPAEVEAACRRHGLLGRTAPPAPDHVRAVLDRVAAYQPLWSLVDLFVMLRPDSPGLIERWRLEQEHELIAATGEGLTDEQVRELVRCFLPFTYLCYERVQADVVIELDENHTGGVVL